MTLELTFPPDLISLPEYATRSCLQSFLFQLSQAPPDTLVTQQREERLNGIEVSIRATKLSPYDALLYKEVVAAIRTLTSHVVRENMFFELRFGLYHNLGPGRRTWKMEGKLGLDQRDTETMHR